MNDKRIVLCGANAYEQKYYFNEKFAGIPESINYGGPEGEIGRAHV